MYSKVLETLDAGTSLDHTAVGLWASISVVSASKPPTPAYDRNAIQNITFEQRQSLANSIPEVPWTTNVHHHAVIITRAIRKWLSSNFPVAKSKPRSSVISDQCWSLRTKRLGLQQQLREGKALLIKYETFIALYAWKFQISLEEAHDLQWHILFFILRSDRFIYQELHFAKSTIRKQLRKDRTTFLETIAQEALTDTPDRFFKILRKAGVTSKKYRSGLQPLPRLQLQDGTFANSIEQIAERWRSFFAQQEDGRVTCPSELTSICQSFTRDVQLDWTEIPTLLDYELAMRRSKSGKAHDLLPGELFRVAAGSLAEKCYPLLLKKMC